MMTDKYKMLFTFPGDTSTSGEGVDAVTTNRLLLKVERKYQGKTLKCSATSEALSQPMDISLQLDLICKYQSSIIKRIPNIWMN